MADLIDRQAAIEAINGIDNVVGCEHITEALSDAINAVASIPSAQPESAKRIAETAQNVSKSDLISRKAAIEAFRKELATGEQKGNYVTISSAVSYLGAKQILEKLPSAQPEIIRCKDCKFYPNHGMKDVVFDADACHWNADEMPDPDDYCSAAERKEGKDEDQNN